MEHKVEKPTLVKEVLAKLYPDSSRRTLKNWLEKGRFCVNGRIVTKENEELQEGHVLSSKETFRPPRISGLKILYEDRYLIAVDKPEGLLSVPLDEESGTHHALGLLKEAFQTSGIFAIHRLDREASGVLLFARGKESEERMKKLFVAHDLDRRYFAIVEGRMKEDKGTWKSHLLELPTFDVVESKEGKEAITHFEVIRKSAKYTYLRVTLFTGKKHQIRVHSQMAGHPILGDLRYGAKENPIRRLCLHATNLEFLHPFTKKRLRLKSSIPFAFKKLGASL